MPAQNLSVFPPDSNGDAAVVVVFFALYLCRRVDDIFNISRELMTIIIIQTLQTGESGYIVPARNHMYLRDALQLNPRKQDGPVKCGYTGIELVQRFGYVASWAVMDPGLACQFC